MQLNVREGLNPARRARRPTHATNLIVGTLGQVNTRARGKDDLEDEDLSEEARTTRNARGRSCGKKGKKKGAGRRPFHRWKPSSAHARHLLALLALVGVERQRAVLDVALLVEGDVARHPLVVGG